MADGREVPVYEFVGRDVHAVDDTGRLPARFRVSGYVGGEDWIELRDALIDASAARPGVGVLVLPTFGALRVVCSSIETSEDYDAEGRFCRLAWEFVREGGEPSPVVRRRAVVSVTPVEAASATAFAGVWSLDGPSWLGALAASDVGLVIAGLAAGVGVVVEAAAAGAALAALGLAVVDVLTDPEALALLVADAFGALGLVATVAALVELLTDPHGSSGPSPSLAQRAQNRAGFVSLARRSAIARAAELLVADESLTTRPVLLGYRDAVVSWIDDEGERSDVPPALRRELSTLRAAVIDAVAVRADGLAELRTWVAPGPVSSLVVSYRFHGDADHAAAIAARAGAHWPGQLSGTLTIEAEP